MDKGIDVEKVVEVIKTANEMNEISIDDLKKFDDVVETVFTSGNVLDSKACKRVYEKYLENKENMAKKLKDIEEKRKEIVNSMKVLCDDFEIDYGTIY